MSAGKEVSQICMEDSCAWYLKSYKACSAYVLAYDAALDIKKQQDVK
jgi:hypothetical protein